MPEYRVETSIAATPEDVWAVLTDAPRYPDWNPAVQQIDGVIAPNEKFKLTATVNPGRAFTLRVTEFSSARSMTWTGGMPLGAFTGVRTFGLDPQAGGATVFSMREVYTGWMLGMMTKTLPDLTESFEQFAAGLKARAEAGAA